MMQFLQDTQVEGRLFPRGAQVKIVKAGTLALVLPDPGVYTTLCAVRTAMKRWPVVPADELRLFS